jgi:hypothetical protein
MVRPVFVLGSSVLALNFDDNVNDESGYGNNGVLSGAAYTAGKINNGLSFDGVDDYVSIADAPSLDLTKVFTIMAWIKADSYGEANLGRIIDKVGAYTFFLSATDKNLSMVFYVSAAVHQFFSTANSLLIDGKWHHVAVTFDNSLASANVKFFIDGVAKGTANDTSTIDTNANSLYVGNRSALDRTFDGIIDEVYIYDRALSQSEIEAIMNGARVVKV